MSGLRFVERYIYTSLLSIVDLVIVLVIAPGAVSLVSISILARKIKKVGLLVLFGVASAISYLLFVFDPFGKYNRFAWRAITSKVAY